MLRIQYRQTIPELTLKGRDIMETKRKAKGSWGVRFFIILLGISLGILFFWLLSFVVNDIGTVKGPDPAKTRSRYISNELDQKKISLEKEVKNIKRKIVTESEQQKLIEQSTKNLQNTISQLLTLQKDSLKKNIEFTEKSKQTLQEAQAGFLENQKKYQEYNISISNLTQQQRSREDELNGVTETIKTKEKQVNEEYSKLINKHKLRLAILKLAFLVPVFLAVSFVFMKYRSSAYWSLVWAIFIAVFIKIATVVHEYFPAEYFKYIALLVIIAIVLKISFFLIRQIVAPKKDLLIKQYQQHYDKCICPICSKPIRTGPLRFIGGLGNKAKLMTGQFIDTAQQVYSCPSCGESLYENCQKCGHVRHTLLPYCEHCGVKKTEV